jgi:hypothetical protein
MGLYVSETWVNQSKGWIVGENEPYETYCDTIQELFLAMQQEYGRCAGRQYVDLKAGGSKQIGWVFEKRQKYTDCNETYLAETWVTVYKEQPTLVPRHFTGETFEFA